MKARVLIAGGGPAAIELILALQDLAGDEVEIGLLVPEREFSYRPLAVAKPFSVTDVPHFSLSQIAEDRGFRLVPGTLAGVDPAKRRATTTDGRGLSYDHLVIAVGARPREALAGAITFKREADSATFRSLLDDLDGTVRRIAFVVPQGVTWPLPIYELALMTATRARGHAIAGVRLTLVTPEEEPLSMFGSEPSREVSRLLADAGIEVRTSTLPAAVDGTRLIVVPGPAVPAERVVALPRLEGPHIPGLPADAGGFIPTDSFGEVDGIESVYAAGDATTFPIKQGGIATQQADVVAQAIAAKAGAEVEPEPFKPVLRGLLLTGGPPSYLRGGLATDPDGGLTDVEPLWWPPSKIAGRYLSRYLSRVQAATPPDAGVRVEVDDIADVVVGA
jgi:sulfide:quinone oxidoreductase